MEELTDEEFVKLFPELALPGELEYGEFRPHLGGEVREVGTKKFVEMSNTNGKKARIILWADERVTVIATDKNGEPHISETKSPAPEQFYIMQAHFSGLGFRITREEEE